MICYKISLLKNIRILDRMVTKMFLLCLLDCYVIKSYYKKLCLIRIYNLCFLERMENANRLHEGIKE